MPLPDEQSRSLRLAADDLLVIGAAASGHRESEPSISETEPASSAGG